MVSQIATQGSLFDLISVLDYGQSVLNVASYLVKPLLDNRPLSTKIISSQMNRYFLGTAAEGAWQWKDAYEAVEVALILYLRRKGLPQNPVEELQLLESLCPTHTRRSEEQLKLQQFSTPLPLAYLVAMAGQINSNDLVLEPSAGTGILAQFAKLKGASLMLNELAIDRSKILRRLFPGVPLFSVNAEQVNDYLAGQTKPSVVLMNPPFSASPKISDRNPDATPRHVNSALQRLADGGRLVTISANWFSPSNPIWRETFTKMQEKATTVAANSEQSAVRFRRGWFLGDGTGAGKGRQVAGIVLDNWCQGRRKAIWVSKSSALIEDARRDWCALGGSEKDIIDLGNIKLSDPIPFSEGVLFATYSTLRSQKGGKSRLKQIIDWAGKEFEGAIAFDECHAMGNAMAQEGKLGMVKASMQGIVGLRLQNALPSARVVYVSATGATKVSNLSYANRLGLWQTGDFPFTSREDFVESIEVGGIAAMEVVARDLKALGLYLARSLSFEGVEYDTLEIDLTPTQSRIYDSYADAFEIIHNNLHKALEACNISGAKTYNRMAKMSAMSQFESHKQRFFNHLLTGMKCPKLIKAIEQDIAIGHAVVIQIVSTNEELLKRKLYGIPTEEWKDLNLDLTPREYMMDYLMSAFPIHLYEIHSSENGDERSEPIFDADGSPIISQAALVLRDQLVDQLTSLDPIPGALEQLLWHFGHSQVAEVTGRSKRVLKDSTERLFVDSRGNGANIAETTAFMGDEKQILIFSDAGGTGRSYHADLNAINRRRRSHYLLEAGWRADNAIQGLGRSHRTNQASAPIFRPVTTNVRGERRFISTIARRLDSLGALTRGQRQTGGNGIFDTKDNFESEYAEYALYELFKQIYQGRFTQVPLGTFEEMTGLSLTSTEGGMKIDLPPLRQFLNRLLALRIRMQNLIFERFELLLSQQIETAIAHGIFEVGVETLRAERFTVASIESVYTHPGTGSVTNYLKIERVQKTDIKTAAEAVEFATNYQGRLMVNSKSGSAAVCIPTHSIFDDQGGVVPRVLLVRPQKETRVPQDKLQASEWKQVSTREFVAAWSKEVNELPKFTTDYIHLVTGILLPIWKTLPCQNSRVFRLQLSNGEKVLGRVVNAENIRQVAEQLGMKNKLLSPEELVHLVLNERYSEQLPGGVTLRCSTIASERRIELVNALSLADRLVTVGCFTEIIQWRKRVFIPTNEKAPAILAAVIEILG